MLVSIIYFCLLLLIAASNASGPSTRMKDNEERRTKDGWGRGQAASKQASTRFFLGALFPDGSVLSYGGRVLAVSRGCWRRTCRALANHSWSAARPSPIVLIDVRLAIGDGCATDRSSVGRGYLQVPSSVARRRALVGDHGCGRGGGPQHLSPSYVRV